MVICYYYKGFMKEILEAVYKYADKRGVSVILDTDDKDKYSEVL